MASGSTKRGREHQWSQLLPELLEAISQRLAISDYVRFRAVCKSWRSSAARPIDLRRQLPWLTLPYDVTSRRRHFFSLSDNKVHALDLPEARNKAIIGSSYGWLTLLDPTAPDSALSLLNPITGAQIALPPMNILREGRAESVHNWTSHSFAWKVSLSSHPTAADCVFANILNGVSKLIFCKPGDTDWAVLDVGLPLNIHGVTYRRGRFYAIDIQGNGVVVDVDRPQAKPVAIPPPSIAGPADTPCYINFLFKSSYKEEREDILVLASYFRSEVRFYVMFKLEESSSSGEAPRWSEIKGADGRAVLVAESITSAVCVGVRDCPNAAALKGDCIYFSCPHAFRHLELYGQRAHFLHILNLKDHSYDALVCPWEKPSGIRHGGASWLMPSLC